MDSRVVTEDDGPSDYNSRDLDDDHRCVVLWWETSATMGIFSPLVASITIGGWIGLLIFLGAIFLNYWALARIINQSGFSTYWLVLPLAPLVLTILCYVIFWRDLHAIAFGGGFGFGDVSSVSLYWHLDEISIVLNWIMFLVFAFSQWPATGRQSRVADSPSAAPAPSSRGPATGSTPPSEPVRAARVMPSSGAGPGSGPVAASSAASPNKPNAKFCPWCGESLPGNRALFHDCGPKDRPETVCRSCGKAFPAGTSQCDTCAAS